MTKQTSTALAQEYKTETETPNTAQSLILMRNLIRTSLSSICYLRSLFPEDCFSDKILNGINIKALKSVNGETKTLRNWLEKGVFDALEKRYLRKIIFGIYEESDLKDENMLECYEFNIAYPNSSEITLDIQNGQQRTLKAQTKSEIRKATATMIRTIILLSETLKPLPQARYISMKLFYFDEVTPSGYEPEFFKDAGKQKEYNFAKKPVTVKIGEFQTISHTLCLQIKTSPDLFEDIVDDEDLETKATAKPMPVEQPVEKIEETQNIPGQESQVEAAEEVQPAEKETIAEEVPHAGEAAEEEEADGDGNGEEKALLEELETLILSGEIKPIVVHVSTALDLQPAYVRQLFVKLLKKGVLKQKTRRSAYTINEEYKNPTSTSQGLPQEPAEQPVGEVPNEKESSSNTKDAVTDSATEMDKKLAGIYESALKSLSGLYELTIDALGDELRISRPFASDIMHRMEGEGVIEKVKRNGKKKYIVNEELVAVLLDSKNSVEAKNTNKRNYEEINADNLVDLWSQVTNQTQESAWSTKNTQVAGYKKRRTYGGDVPNSPMTPKQPRNLRPAAGETPQLTNSMKTDLEKMVGQSKRTAPSTVVKCSVTEKPIQNADMAKYATLKVREE